MPPLRHPISETQHGRDDSLGLHRLAEIDGFPGRRRPGRCLPPARVTAGNSSIRLGEVAGEVYAKTSFGGVTVDQAGGPITVENANGSITVAARPGKPFEPISLHTSFAPIRLTIPEGAGYNVTAHTSFAKITSEPELAVSGPLGGDSLTGRIAGGGCDLRLLNANGAIEIRKGQKK